jgi:hypothetical protein
MTENSGPDGNIAGSGVPTEETAVEAKRLAARRRFLLGGASALPLIVTLGTKEAWAASAGVCQSLSMGYDKKYVKTQFKTQYGDPKDYDRDERRGLAVSLYCDPRRRWT